jgi:hypothetical protein
VGIARDFGAAFAHEEIEVGALVGLEHMVNVEFDVTPCG